MEPESGIQGRENASFVCFICQHAISTALFKKIDFENGTLFYHMFCKQDATRFCIPVCFSFLLLHFIVVLIQPLQLFDPSLLMTFRGAQLCIEDHSFCIICSNVVCSHNNHSDS